jgi:hypothetical protein
MAAVPIVPIASVGGQWLAKLLMADQVAATQEGADLPGAAMGLEHHRPGGS